jgi:hypothetical protein
MPLLIEHPNFGKIFPQNRKKLVKFTLEKHIFFPRFSQILTCLVQALSHGEPENSLELFSLPIHDIHLQS